MRKMKRMVQRKEREKRVAKKRTACCAIALAVMLGSLSPMLSTQAYGNEPSNIVNPLVAEEEQSSPRSRCEVRDASWNIWDGLGRGGSDVIPTCLPSLGLFGLENLRDLTTIGSALTSTPFDAMADLHRRAGWEGGAQFWEAPAEAQRAILNGAWNAWDNGMARAEHTITTSSFETMERRYNDGRIDSAERESMIRQRVLHTCRELFSEIARSDVSFTYWWEAELEQQEREAYLREIKQEREASLMGVAGLYPATSDFRDPLRSHCQIYMLQGGSSLAAVIRSSLYSAIEWQETWEEVQELNALIQELARIRGEYTVGNSHWEAQFMDPSNREYIARAKEEFMNRLTPSERMALGLPRQVESAKELVEEKTKSPEPPSSTWTVDENNASTYYTDCEPGVAWTGDRGQEDYASDDKKSTSPSFSNWNDEPADTIYTDCEPGIAWTRDRDQEEETSSGEDSSDSSSDGNGTGDSGSNEEPTTTIRQDSNDDNKITRTPDKPGIPAPPSPDNNSNDGTCPIGEVPLPPPANLPEAPPELPEGTVHSDNPPPAKDTADHGCGANQDMTE